ncbi:leucyl/phenylalanyl-tRNA--protein transferase [Marinomonas sp. 2405UD68-3]|uniref:leucyl/phenylalanyl-tRNA--protein transferase n=1 Tax=Marinomonas sp. 2405UD68-3 TaxID=3391835 RepID=UPI0039C98FB7
MTQPATNKSITYLNESPFEIPFPENALDEPDGLCAMGGDLSKTRLINMYQHGFFPWYSEPDPILWWHPKERCALFPTDFHLSRSLKKHIKKQTWTVKVNTSFSDVIQACSDSRADKEGTWISNDIKNAYSALHRSGVAHSIEVWEGDLLIGGLYGVCLGRVFFGESMFSRKENASKTALYALCQHANAANIHLIDCQVESDHLITLGATLIPRIKFCDLLDDYCTPPQLNGYLQLNSILPIQV